MWMARHYVATVLQKGLLIVPTVGGWLENHPKKRIHELKQDCSVLNARQFHSDDNRSAKSMLYHFAEIRGSLKGIFQGYCALECILC